MADKGKILAVDDTPASLKLGLPQRWGHWAVSL